jgi:hypothetical protein
MPTSRAELAAIAHIVQRLSAQFSALDADLADPPAGLARLVVRRRRHRVLAA